MDLTLNIGVIRTLSDDNFCWVMYGMTDWPSRCDMLINAKAFSDNEQEEKEHA